jgi:hypothetical protein
MPKNMNIIATQIALSKPSVQYRDTIGCKISTNNVDIDNDSFLRYNAMMTHHGEKITLPQTGFTTIPFMGSGCNTNSYNSRIEFEYNYSPKSSYPQSTRNRFTPLVGCLANEIQNTIHIIPEDNKEGWKRGGIASRDCKLVDQKFKQKITN